MVAQRSGGLPSLTAEGAADLFMLTVPDDTKDAPWMVMGDAQFWSASSLAHSLHTYAHLQGLSWYVASMLPINYTWTSFPRIRTVAPDVFVSFVEDRPRQSYDLAAEGVFPPFVLEVVSPSSVARDLEEKRAIYWFLGAREYALFRPDDENTPLWGYRSAARTGVRARRRMPPRWEAWPLDDEGRLWSAVLGLHLVVRNGLVQAMTPEGRLLPTPEQAELAWHESETARAQAEAARQESEAARRLAEQEIARLRAELERLKDHEDH